MHGLGRLVAEGAAHGVLQTAASEAVRGPTLIKMDEPVEEPNARRCPTLPGKLPSVASGGTVESGQVCRLGGVEAACAPFLD